jgi:predicted ferric reductase
MKLGYKIIILSLICTITIWVGSKWFYADWFANPYKYVAKTASLGATVLFCWSFILSARYKIIENWFGGLDKVYKAHSKIGMLSFGLILFHPVFLAVNRLPDVAVFLTNLGFQAWSDNYLLGHNLGVIAFLSLVALLFITAWQKIPYHIWRQTHEWFGIFGMLVFLHIFFVDADIAKYPLLKVWMYSWLFLAAMSFIWIRFLYTKFGPVYRYKISGLEMIENVFFEITLLPIHKHMEFLPSQHVFLELENSKFGRERHPFSIAKIPNSDGEIKLGIKALGDYTSRLNRLQLGDAVKLYGPYGSFSEKFLSKTRDCVFIGAGIGITPFLGMWEMALNASDELNQELAQEAEHENKTKPTKLYKNPRVHLYYVCDTIENATFHNDIAQIEIKNKFSGFSDFEKRGHRYELFLCPKKRKITAEYIAQNSGDLTGKFIFICGPAAMKNSLIKQLKSLGVQNKNIITEEFDYRNVRFSLKLNFDIFSLGRIFDFKKWLWRG